MAADFVGRAVCAICQRPQTACICRWITQVNAGVEVLILQHPLEVNSAKNSARLLHLCLPGSRMLVGEVFDEAELADPARQDILLYPDDSGVHQPPEPAPGFPLQPLHKQRLIVLDATWRKSRKLLYLNAWLRELPRLSLTDAPASRYLIRKAHKPGQLSTLEATCAALILLESDEKKYQSLLAAFEGFVGQQAGYMSRGSELENALNLLEAHSQSLETDERMALRTQPS